MTSDEVLERIRIAGERQWSSLEISPPVPPEIGKLTQLTSLSISPDSHFPHGYRPKSLPAEIGNLTRLTSLSINGSILWGRLTSLPSWIGNLAQLTSLDLAFNSLDSLPPEIGNLTQLTSLNLTSNSLDSLPSWIGNLTQLTSLNLTSNSLDSLPPEIGNLIQLTSLDLKANRLDSLPPEIGNLTQLTSLNLNKGPAGVSDNNGLESLPQWIGNLTRLTSLDLGGNGLMSLPPEIGNVTRLTSLDLGGNSLESLRSEIGNLTQLTSLDLGDNSLESLPSEVGNLTQLTSLDLSSNSLKLLPPEIGNLTQLTSLDLSSNSLESLPSEVGNLTELTSLNLGRNRLTTLPAEVGDLILRINFLDLRGNPLAHFQPLTRIRRSIEFPPEYQTAGMSVLSYFGQVVKEKYPNLDVGVSIQQKGKTVSMTVETPEGEKEKIEKTLDEYGLVVTGQMAPEDFLENQLAVIKLESELRAAENRLAMENKISLFKDREIQKQDLRIDGLLNLIGDMVSKKTVQTLNVHASSTATAQAQATIDLQANLGQLLGTLRELADELPEGEERQVIEKTAAALERIEGESDPAEVRKSPALSKLRRLVGNLSDGSKTLGKAIDAIKDGREMAQEIATLAGELLKWCGL